MSVTWYEIVLPPVVTLATIVIGGVLLWMARGHLSEFVSDLRVRSVEILGVNLEFVEQQAVATYKKQGLAPPSSVDLAGIRDAARFLAPLAVQSHVLWVDDAPGNNDLERTTLLTWEVAVQAARTTDEAICELEDPKQAFDLVISDWRRPGDSDDRPAGLELMERMAGFPQPVIFYHGAVGARELAERRRRAREAGAVGATGSPGELLRWVLLELARKAIEQPRPIQRERREQLLLLTEQRDTK